MSEQADGSRVGIRYATEPSFGGAIPTSTKAVTAASNAAPIVITATAHGYVTGQIIKVASVGGNTNANGIWEVTRLTADTFSLNGSVGNGAYTSGGTARAAVLNLRKTGEGLKYTLEKVRSKETRTDRQASGLVLISASAGGGIPFELSYKEFDFMMAAVLRNLWSVYGHRGVGATFTGTFSANNTLTASVAPTGASAFTNLKKGQWVKLGGASISANNIIAQISNTTAPTTTVLVFEGTPFTDGAAGAACYVAGSRLTNGTQKRSLGIEREHGDITQIFPFVGMVPVDLSFNFSQGAILTGNITFMGKNCGAAITATAMATPEDSAAYDVMNPVTGISRLQRDGVTLTESLMNITLNITNSSRNRAAIANLGPINIADGSVMVSGAMEAYLEDGTRFDIFVDNDPFKITFAVLDGSENGYIFTIPRARFSDDNPGDSSENSDIMTPGAFEAEFDSTDTDTAYNRTIFIDRVGVAV